MEILILSRPQDIAAGGAPMYSLNKMECNLQTLLQMQVHHTVCHPLAYSSLDIPLTLTLLSK